ncbi:MAG: hypothetical protein AB1725_10800 [Armatimonadota bacterium]
MQRLLFGTILVGASLAAPAGWGQSFNVDLDGFFGPRPLGTGVPQPSFGGAAGQRGLWNFIYVLEHRTIPLQDISGRWTGATYTAWGGIGSGGGWRNPRLAFGEVNDDFWLLMGDAAEINPPFAPHQIMPPDPLIIYTFDGLQPGLYDVLTYGVVPAQPPRTSPVYVTVPGAATENPQICTGPMPLDWAFRQGVTHTLHRVAITDGRLHIRVTADRNRWALVNGFQIVKVK